MIELFAGNASQAIGIDRSSEMLRLARVKLEAAGIVSSLRQGDMYALPLTDGSADSIIIHQVLHYAHSPAAAIAELERQSNINEDIILFLTIRVDEHEAGPSAMMRRGEKERERRSDRGDREDRPNFRAREEEVE